MKVFCPEHKRGFLTPRQSPIRCENRGHLLGELDFQGEAKLPLALQWQYCCNCEYFCPVDFDQDGLERCPVCNRRSSLLYLCDRCYTVSFESNTPLQTKNFTLTSEGAPQPSCPGCLQPASANLREHTCEELGASLVTALNSCPICQERLDIGPSFPASVAHYLRKTRAANKINVTFDYESALFVPVEDGEFVLIRTGDETIQTIVLPRTERFASRRDFYEFYQDYYHSAKPEAGEVHIIEPAAVVPTEAGWKLLATGILEVVAEQSEKSVLSETTHRRVDVANEEPRLSSDVTTEESPQTTCAHCGSLVEMRYAFCWKCGNPLASTSSKPTANGASVTHWEGPRAIKPSTQVAHDDEEVTVQHDVRRAGSTMFSWVTPPEPERPGAVKGSVLKLITVVVIGLILVSLGLVVLTRSTSRLASVTAAQPVAADVQAGAIANPDREVRPAVTSEITPQRTSGVRSVDDELKALRAKRIAATISDRNTLLQAFARAEKQFPNDYRFPYERAKAAIVFSSSHSHDAAFSALSLAAQEAINNGKAHEMLDSLETDKSGDFHKLSHGHLEWKQLAEALSNKDAKLMTAKAQF